MSLSGRFRFDSVLHEYIDLETGIVLPHITGMLERTGWIDDTWFTEESSERGRIVHKLTADYDLGAIEAPESVESSYKAYLLAYVKAIKIMRPTILAVEEPIVHRTLKFGGRPDRRIIYNRAKGVLEIKAAVPAKSHPIQTALQAILCAEEFELPPEALLRLCVYVKKDGKFKVEEHRDRRDLDEGYRIIKRCAA